MQPPVQSVQRQGDSGDVGHEEQKTLAPGAYGEMMRRPKWSTIALLVVAAMVASIPLSLATLSLARRDRVLTEGTSYGLRIGMSKEEAYRALTQRYDYFLARPRDLRFKGRPAGVYGVDGDLSESNHWEVSSFNELFVERHALFFDDGALIYVISQGHFILPERRGYVGPDGEAYTPL